MMKILTAILFLTLSACTDGAVDSTPGKVLESYIKISFSATGVLDKKRMEGLLTGDTRLRLASWSDEQFSKAFIESPKKFQGLKVLESKKVNEQEFALTYEIAFEEGAKDKAAQITQRKMCTVVREDGAWKIKEVRSIRESIEYLQEFTLP
jgi:hypothetical protein